MTQGWSVVYIQTRSAPPDERPPFLTNSLAPHRLPACGLSNSPSSPQRTMGFVFPIFFPASHARKGRSCCRELFPRSPFAPPPTIVFLPTGGFLFFLTWVGLRRRFPLLFPLHARFNTLFDLTVSPIRLDPILIFRSLAFLFPFDFSAIASS